MLPSYEKRTSSRDRNISEPKQQQQQHSAADCFGSVYLDWRNPWRRTTNKEIVLVKKEFRQLLADIILYKKICLIEELLHLRRQHSKQRSTNKIHH